MERDPAGYGRSTRTIELMTTQAEGITGNGEAGQEAERATRRIMFAGGKGGVGTTQIAANLAVALGLKHSRVLFVDATPGIVNTEVILGINLTFDLRHVVTGEKSIEEIICRGPGGIGILPVRRNWEPNAAFAPWQRERLSRGMAAATAAFDFVLVDAPAGIPAELPRAALDPAEVIIVTTVEPTSLAGAYATVKELARLSPGKKAGVIVNMASDRSEAARAFRAIAHVAGRFLGTVPGYLGWVPADVSVTDAGRRQTPFVVQSPDQPAAGAVEVIASRLATAQESGDNLRFIDDESWRN